MPQVIRKKCSGYGKVSNQTATICSSSNLGTMLPCVYCRNLGEARPFGMPVPATRSAVRAAGTWRIDRWVDGSRRTWAARWRSCRTFWVRRPCTSWRTGKRTAVPRPPAQPIRRPGRHRPRRECGSWPRLVAPLRTETRGTQTVGGSGDLFSSTIHRKKTTQDTPKRDLSALSPTWAFPSLMSQYDHV